MIKEKILHVREKICECHQVYGKQYTVVGLFDDEKMTISYGIAKTHKDDNFSKKITMKLRMTKDMIILFAFFHQFSV